MIEFKPFPKIPRLYRELVITEKIDGTPAAVIVDDQGNVAAQSRSRLITPENDNFRFAAWVQDHSKELVELGVGHHYGEWWGRGIQRGYGLEEKRFSLFNASKYPALPVCVRGVPLIYPEQQPWSLNNLDEALGVLKEHGSLAAPGFMQPEGIVVFHTASRSSFKVLIDNDQAPKGYERLGAHNARAVYRIGDLTPQGYVVTYDHLGVNRRAPFVGDVNIWGQAWENGEWTDRY